jgi:hypothetical protein
MSATITEKTISVPTLQIRELKNGFGVEVRGLDLKDGASDETYRLLQDLLTKVSAPKTFSWLLTYYMCSMVWSSYARQT